MRFTKRLATNKKGKPVLRPTGTIFTFPAPTGGWNARDPLGGMAPTDAVVMDNYMPTTADVKLRRGSAPYVTGMGAGVKMDTLVRYSKGATEEMWAAGGGKIYNASVTGAAPAASVVGQTNDQWQNTVFTTSGDTRLVMVNGADSMLQYDGAAWHVITAVSAPIAITSVVTSTLINVWSFMSRLFFIQKNSLLAWYLPVDSFGGAAASIDLGTIFKWGGHLVAGGAWTRDGGDGMDDLCVFISSHGEVAIFQGTDPSDSDNWSLIGRYEIGAPIGYRCLIKTGADLAIISLDGILGLSTVISLDRAASNKVALSSKIRGAFSEATANFKENFGWEGISYPAQSQVWFNIPVEEGANQQQYILNTITGSWCRFLNLTANTWCLFKEQLYFGNNNGQVWIADSGDSDNGAVIAGFFKTAFIYHNGKATQKKYNMIRPIVYSDVGLPFGCALAVDFNPTLIAPAPSSSNNTGFSVWNVATWDVDPWSTVVALKDWRTVAGVGTCASVLFATNTIGYSISLNSIDILFDPGGIL